MSEPNGHPPLVRFEIEPDELAPVPDDKAADVEVVDRIVGYCMSKEFDMQARRLPSSFGNVTGWVALQLGVLVEHQNAAANYGFAFRLAAMAIDAALEARSFARFAANYLSFCNLYLPLKDYELARVAFGRLLEMTLAGGRAERGAALLTLGSLARIAGDQARAISLTERGLAYVRSRIQKAEHQTLIKGLVHAYRETSDLAGAAYAAYHLGFMTADAIVRPLVVLPFERVLTVCTRFRSLGEPDLAGRLEVEWLARRRHL
jgi:tetratricopeptide (TPR) repeat protein